MINVLMMNSLMLGLHSFGWLPVGGINNFNIIILN